MLQGPAPAGTVCVRHQAIPPKKRLVLRPKGNHLIPAYCQATYVTYHSIYFTREGTKCAENSAKKYWGCKCMKNNNLQEFLRVAGARIRSAMAYGSIGALAAQPGPEGAVHPGA